MVGAGRMGVRGALYGICCVLCFKVINNGSRHSIHRFSRLEHGAQIYVCPHGNTTGGRSFRENSSKHTTQLNGTTAAVTETGDFAAIIRRRIFERAKVNHSVAALVKALYRTIETDVNVYIFYLLVAKFEVVNHPKSDNFSSFLGNAALLLVHINTYYNILQKTIDKNMKNLSATNRFVLYIFEK